MVAKEVQLTVRCEPAILHASVQTRAAPPHSGLHSERSVPLTGEQKPKANF